MDVDHPISSGSSRVNAEAGPSSQLQPAGASDLPPIFLPQPGPSRRRPPLDSTQDLITRFRLLPTYDKYVRPHIHASDFSPAAPRTPVLSHVDSAPTPGALDKGKGREVQAQAFTPGPVGAPSPARADGGDGEDGEEETGKGDKKQKNSYRHLIKGIPGKHSTKKDDFLQTLMLVPLKQHITISKFDPRSQREAFTVSPEGLKQWNINALVAESAQAREDRKKRKELKKLAKAQAQAAQSGMPLPTLATGTPLAAPSPGIRQPRTPASVGVGTPKPNAGPGPGPPYHAPTPTNAASQQQRSSTPVPRPGSKVRKRELEDEGLPNGNISVGGGGGGGVNGNANMHGQNHTPHPSTNLQAGMKRPSSGQQNMGVPGKSGVPRPSKRPRTDTASHQISIHALPQQQPTPQGV